MYANTVILVILKGKDKVLGTMSQFFRYTWDNFEHIFSCHFKSNKAMKVKFCTIVKATEIHILALNKVYKMLHFLRYLKEKESTLFF